MYTLFLFREREARDSALPRLERQVEQSSFSGAYVLSTDHDGSNLEVIYPHGIYLIVQDLDEGVRTQLYRDHLRTWPDSREELDELVSGDWYWESECISKIIEGFEDHDTLEVSGPEKLHHYLPKWPIVAVKRLGRCASDGTLISDDEIMAGYPG